MAPMAAVVATEEPDSAAKNMHATMATIDRPPRTDPVIAFANAMSRVAIPPCCMTAPASMKKKIARREYCSLPSSIFCAKKEREMPGMER